MLSFGGARRVWLAVGSTDLRKNFDGLHALVVSRLGGDPLSGDVFVFANRRLTRIKVLHFDGSGLWICAKRLERGRFAWPMDAGQAGSAAAALTLEELTMLLGGIDLAQSRHRRWWRAPAGGRQRTAA